MIPAFDWAAVSTGVGLSLVGCYHSRKAAPVPFHQMCFLVSCLSCEREWGLRLSDMLWKLFMFSYLFSSNDFNLVTLHVHILLGACNWTKNGNIFVKVSNIHDLTFCGFKLRNEITAGGSYRNLSIIQWQLHLFILLIGVENGFSSVQSGGEDVHVMEWFVNGFRHVALDNFLKHLVYL